VYNPSTTYHDSAKPKTTPPILPNGVARIVRCSSSCQAGEGLLWLMCGSRSQSSAASSQTWGTYVWLLTAGYWLLIVKLARSRG